MNHSDVQRHLADYLEGDLPIEERALFDAHLDECGECAQELDQMLQTIRLLRRLPEPEVPPMIAANVMRRIRAGESQVGWWERVSRAVGAILEPGFVLPASAIAAGALVIAVVQGGEILPGSNLLAEIPILGGADPSVSSMTPTIATPRSSFVPRPDAADIAARVERRANRSVALPGPSGGRVAETRVGTSAPQIRIEFDSRRLSRSMSPVIPSSPGSSETGFAPQLPAGWGLEGSSLVARARSGQTSNGTLVAAERLGPIDSSTGSDVWLPSGDQVGADPRDAWLALGFEEPAEFARYIAAQNLAEQELWAERLSDRASSRGLLEEFIQRLRDSGDATAAWVADDFEAQARGDGVASSRSESSPRR